MIKDYWPIISTGINIVFLPIITYLCTQARASKKRQKAQELGIQALLRDRLVQSYYHYTERGWISLHGMEAVNSMYEQYHNLGGNGTVTCLVKVMQELDVRDEAKT